MSEHTRIKFYSVHDLSFASNMKRVESFFEKWEQNTCSPDINTILELYNIKQYFSTGRVLSTWSNEQLDEYQKKVSLIPGIIGRFCNSVLDEEWNCMFKSTEINYVDDFWTVIDNYKVYSKISANTIGSILDSNSDCVWYILRHRALSAYYGTVLTNHLLTNCNTAPRMISFFLETSSEQDDHLYFPEEFTPEMRIKIINDYVDEENPNINTLQLLENARVFDGQPIEDKLRRKVRNKRKELQEKLSDKAVYVPSKILTATLFASSNSSEGSSVMTSATVAFAISVFSVDLKPTIMLAIPCPSLLLIALSSESLKRTVPICVVLFLVITQPRDSLSAEMS